MTNNAIAIHGAFDRNTRSGHVSFLGQIGNVLRSLATFPQRQQVRDELSNLSDRELADIGLTRADVAYVFDAEYVARRDAAQQNLRAARRATV
jgi:uncharacterized protein YjiS (DUF1127 family)